MISSKDWKIHKKLDEARTIYYWPARGQGRSCVREILELMSDGKKVVVIPRKAPKDLVGRRLNCNLLDKDILTLEQYERADNILREYLKNLT